MRSHRPAIARCEHPAGVRLIGIPTDRRLAPAAALALLVVSMVTSGCTAVVVAGSATTAVVLQDRRALTMQIEDERRERDIATRLRSIDGDGLHADITSYNGVVLLTGTSRDDQTRSRAVSAARSTPGARRVVNEIRLSDNNETAATSTENWLTARVRTRLINTRELDSGHVRLVTDAGTVYLFGMVTPREGDLATEAARTVEGVNRVVKLFEYIE